MPETTDQTTDNGAEKTKCLHCKKFVATSCECLKCGGIFHPACMNQANEAKSKQCRHMDIKNLVKEVESQNKTIQRLITRVSGLEDAVANLGGNSDNQHENLDCGDTITVLTEKIEALENKIKLLGSSSVEAGEDIANTTASNMKSSMESPNNNDTISTISTELRNQSEQIGIMLHNVVGAIKSSNAELVRFLTENPQLPLNQRQSTYTTGEISNKITTPLQRALNGKGNGTTPGINDDTNLKSSGKTEIQSAKTRVVIRGTSDAVTDIAAATERRWIYVGNLSYECNVDQIKKHLSNNNIPIISCEKISGRNSNSTSFKIAVDPGLEGTVLRGEIWPVNVIVKPFFSAIWGVQTTWDIDKILEPVIVVEKDLAEDGECWTSSNK